MKETKKQTPCAMFTSPIRYCEDKPIELATLAARTAAGDWAACPKAEKLSGAGEADGGNCSLSFESSESFMERRKKTNLLCHLGVHCSTEVNLHLAACAVHLQVPLALASKSVSMKEG